MTKFIVEWDEHHRAEVDADDTDDALEKAAYYAGEHDTNMDSDNYRVMDGVFRPTGETAIATSHGNVVTGNEQDDVVTEKKYTVRWVEHHTVADVEAKSENEAIMNALQMADNSYYRSDDFTAVVEEEG